MDWISHQVELNRIDSTQDEKKRRKTGTLIIKTYHKILCDSRNIFECNLFFIYHAKIALARWKIVALISIIKLKFVVCVSGPALNL